MLCKTCRAIKITMAGRTIELVSQHMDFSVGDVIGTTLLIAKRAVIFIGRARVWALVRTKAVETKYSFCEEPFD